MIAFKPCNTDRADAAQAALEAWRQAKDHGAGADEADIRDLIADLGHLCDLKCRDFVTDVRVATNNWRAER